MIGSSQRPLPDNTQHSQETDIHATDEIQTHNLSRRAAADPLLIQRSHWDRLVYYLSYKNNKGVQSLQFPVSDISDRPHNKKVHYEFFLRGFGAPPSRVFGRKLWSALNSAPQLCRQKYTKLGIVCNVKPRRLAEIRLPSAMNCCLPSAGIFRKVKVKVKWVRYRPGVAQRVGRGIALLFHDRGTRRCEWSATRVGRTSPPGKKRYPFYWRLGGPPRRSWRAKHLVPTRIRSRTVQPVVSRYIDWATGPTVIFRIHIKIKRTTQICTQCSLLSQYSVQL